MVKTNKLKSSDKEKQGLNALLKRFTKMLKKKN